MNNTKTNNLIRKVALIAVATIITSIFSIGSFGESSTKAMPLETFLEQDFEWSTDDMVYIPGGGLSAINY